MNGNLAQTVRDSLESRVRAVNVAVRALENAVDDDSGLEAVKAAAQLTEAIGALTVEAGVAGVAL